MKTYQFKIELTARETCNYPDERIFRDGVMKIVNEMPFDDLKKLFICEKIDPEGELDRIEKNSDRSKIDWSWFSYLKKLQRDSIILFTVKINV